jgi:hypothetical protein
VLGRFLVRRRRCVVGPAQPLTEALDQFAAAGGELAIRSKNSVGVRIFVSIIAGGLSGRTGGRFSTTHLPRLARANPAKKDGLAIEFSEYINGTPE